ncbi:hypothetical protein Dsin_005681 [Dipteronia sinensis]|uniref:Uncharacterized protein n=1 Tax=Dipteronia sinensis TaxID=43782 RepID=A0AAE0EF51_9ROSI|nr:hypothetical protein Dsin_005681 [Dipteronia sinensis]
MIGDVRNVDLVTSNDSTGRFLLVRVVIAMNVPLKRSLRVDMLGTRKVTNMLLRHERLLEYCFKCGRLRRITEVCFEDKDDQEVTSEANLWLGTWLLATSLTKRYLYGNGRSERRQVLVGNDVAKASLKCLNDGESLVVVNKTLITMIPKIHSDECVGDFRPIIICNVTYKIVAKVIANRLRGVLGEVTSEAQSALIVGRLISDNTIIGFECIHGIR